MSLGKPCRYEINPLLRVCLGCLGVWRAYVSSSFSRLDTKAPLTEVSTIWKSLCAAVLICSPTTSSPSLCPVIPHARKTNSWSVQANRLKMDGSLWKASLLPFFATLEWHSYSHLILFCDGTAFVAYSVGSFSPVPHPLLRSCTLEIQASHPSTFCTGYYH